MQGVSKDEIQALRLTQLQELRAPIDATVANEDASLHLIDAVLRNAEQDVARLCDELDRDAFMQRDGERQHALHYAAAYDASALLEPLLRAAAQHGVALDAVRNRHGNTPLHAAAANNAATAVARLLAHDASLARVTNEWQESSLMIAAAADAHDVARLLLPHSDEQRDRWQQSALDIATAHGSARVLAVLEKREVKEEKVAVVARSNTRVLSKLIEAPLDMKLFTQLLEDETIDLTGRDFYGLSALVKLAAWNHVEALKLLLDKPSRPSPEELEKAIKQAEEVGAEAAKDYLIELE